MTCALCNADKNLDYYSRAPRKFDYSLESSLEPCILSNAVTSPDDYALIPNSISFLSAETLRLGNIIAQQDEAIAELTATLDKYRSSRQEMLSAQARVYDLLERHKRALSSPIRKLPVEIMREIFLLASSNAVDIADIAWTAMHTCSKWRYIAMETPMLWSKVHVATKRRIPMHPSNILEMPELEWLEVTSPRASNKGCVRHALALSHDVPLVVSFIQPMQYYPKGFADKDFEMLEMLLDRAPRWKKVYFSAPYLANVFHDRLKCLRGRVPMLESFSIEPHFEDRPLDVFDIAPRLRSVSTGGIRGELAFPWPQILRLILNGHHQLSTFLRVLHSAKNIQHLTIWPKSRVVEGHSGDTMDTNSSVILPALHTLDVFANGDSLFLPSKMILPTLERLHVQQCSGYNEVSGNFLDLVGATLRSSGCALTHATFLRIVEFGPAFRDVISQCPTLVYLDVGFTPPRETINDVFAFMKQKNTLPALRTLKITFRECSISEDAPYIGRQFVHTALSRKDTLRAFEGSVHLKVDKDLPYVTILSPADRESLEELKAEGMSISVRMTADGTTWEESFEFA